MDQLKSNSLQLRREPVLIPFDRERSSLSTSSLRPSKRSSEFRLSGKASRRDPENRYDKAPVSVPRYCRVLNYQARMPNRSRSALKDAAFYRNFRTQSSNSIQLITSDSVNSALVTVYFPLLCPCYVWFNQFHQELRSELTTIATSARARELSKPQLRDFSEEPG